MASQLEGGLPFLGQPPTPEAAHAQLSKDIKYSKAALAGATNERDLILRYWNDRIATLQARLERQQQALNKMTRPSTRKGRSHLIKKGLLKFTFQILGCIRGDALESLYLANR
jgi:hypothetical protein